MHFRWGVALIGKLSTGHCSPRCRIVPSLSCFLIFWIEYPVLIYVNNKFCNQNLGFDLYRALLNSFGIFTVCKNFIEAVG